MGAGARGGPIRRKKIATARRPAALRRTMKSFERSRAGLTVTLSLVAALVGLGACTAGGGAADTVPGDAGAAAKSDAGAAVAQDCSGLPSSQAVSQPCCLALGIDACGANLFCAAFDGRTQPTCYLERSRLALEECTEDRQCVSGACNDDLGQCKSMPGASCDAKVGCATVEGTRAVCVEERCQTTEGEIGDACARDADCTNGTCSADHRCVGKEGATCDTWSNDQCGEGLCCQRGTCADCRPGEGESCGGSVECRPGLRCCRLSGSGSYCYPSCN